MTVLKKKDFLFHQMNNLKRYNQVICGEKETKVNKSILGQLVLPAVFSFDNIGNILTFMNSGAIIHLGNIVPK